MKGCEFPLEVDHGLSVGHWFAFDHFTCSSVVDHRLWVAGPQDMKGIGGRDD